MLAGYKFVQVFEINYWSVALNLFPNRNIQLKSSPFWWQTWAIAPFSNIAFASMSINILWSLFHCNSLGAAICKGSFKRGILHHSTEDTTLWSFVKIFNTGRKMLQSSCKRVLIGSALFKSKFFSSGWTWVKTSMFSSAWLASDSLLRNGSIPLKEQNFTIKALAIILLALPPLCLVSVRRTHSKGLAIFLNTNLCNCF